MTTHLAPLADHATEGAHPSGVVTTVSNALSLDRALSAVYLNIPAHS
jgi:hypothetical protein